MRIITFLIVYADAFILILLFEDYALIMLLLLILLMWAANIVSFVTLRPEMFEKMPIEYKETALEAFDILEESGIETTDLELYTTMTQDTVVRYFGTKRIVIPMKLIHICKDSPENLAAIIAHETGHLKMGHGICRQIIRLNIDALTAIITVISYTLLMFVFIILQHRMIINRSKTVKLITSVISLSLFSAAAKRLWCIMKKINRILYRFFNNRMEAEADKFISDTDIEKYYIAFIFEIKHKCYDTN